MGDRGQVRSLGFPGPGRAVFYLSEPEPLGPGELRVQTRWSGLSAGTELASYKGTNPMLTRVWDQDRAVFRSGDPVSGYPVRESGYMAVGEVVESRDPGVEPGGLVAMAYGHTSEHRAAPGELCIPVPDDLDPVLGVFLAQMGPICVNGLLHAAVETLPSHAGGAAATFDLERAGELARRRLRQPWRLPRSAVTAARLAAERARPAAAAPPGSSLGAGVGGRRVLVTGAGVVGLLTALLCRLHGAAEVLVADPDPARRHVAEALGLATADPGERPLWDTVKDTWRVGWGDNGADVVFQCRGRTADLAAALRSLRPQGVVIDLAFYQEPATALRLGDEFHHNGLTVRCAQIGRVPLAVAGSWDRLRLVEETLALLRADGAAIREHLITDVVPIVEAPQVLAELSARERSSLQVVFDHQGGPGPGEAPPER